MPAPPEDIEPKVLDVEQLADMIAALEPLRDVLKRDASMFWLLPKTDGALIAGFVSALIARLRAAEACLEAAK